MPDVLLTGPPRSGTTLACELLNLVPETVALDEPMRPAALRGDLVTCVERFFEETRATIAERGVAPSKHVGGRVTGARISEPAADEGRHSLSSRGEIEVGRRTGDFTLILKHPALFTGGLPDLVRRFRVFAMVRHPLAVLGSWQSVAMPVGKGRLPGAEKRAPELKRALDAIEDVVDRHVYLLRWCFERYLSVLPRDAIVRYEDVVASGGGALRAIVPGAARLAEPLASRNVAARYGEETIDDLRGRIADPGEPWWRLYDRP
ncbi:MAG TPA: hypothetical protein VF587_16410 [Solirubrobacteraceae bacterium]|jgi:hypothetical protein